MKLVIFLIYLWKVALYNQENGDTASEDNPYKGGNYPFTVNEKVLIKVLSPGEYLCIYNEICDLGLKLS